MGSNSTLIYTSELILCSTICVYSATRHNFHTYRYYTGLHQCCSLVSSVIDFHLFGVLGSCKCLTPRGCIMGGHK